jgi:hypothetical protein
VVYDTAIDLDQAKTVLLNDPNRLDTIAAPRMIPSFDSWSQPMSLWFE